MHYTAFLPSGLIDVYKNGQKWYNDDYVTGNRPYFFHYGQNWSKWTKKIGEFSGIFENYPGEIFGLCWIFRGFFQTQSWQP